MFSSKVDGVTTLLNLSFGDFIFIDSFPSYLDSDYIFFFGRRFAYFWKIKDARSY